MDRCFGAVARPGKTCEPKAPSMYLDAQCYGGTLSSFFFFISFSMAGAKPKTPRSVFLSGRFLLFMAGGLSQHPAVIFLFSFTFKAAQPIAPADRSYSEIPV